MDVKLVFFMSGGKRRDFPLKRPVTLLGRQKSCHLRIPLRSVSRRHAQVEVRADGLWVRDLNSSNGTRVNGRRVIEKKLHAGDTITLGAASFVVLIDGRPQRIEPRPTILPSEEAAARRGEEEEAGARREPVSLGPASDLYDDEEDPISALEALAALSSWELVEEAEHAASVEPGGPEAAGDSHQPIDDEEGVVR